MRRLSYASAVILALAPAGTPGARAEDKVVTQELEALKGTWRVVGMRNSGEAAPPEQVESLDMKFTFYERGKGITSSRVTVSYRGEKRVKRSQSELEYAIDPHQAPKQLDMAFPHGAKALAIYKRDNGKLTICTLNLARGERGTRPPDFVPRPDGVVIMELVREY